MTPEERELRRALDARSGGVSPEFRARLAQALGEPPRSTSLTPAIAAFTVIALTVAVVGVLLLSHRAPGPTPRPLPLQVPASSARLTSPTPTPLIGSGGAVHLPSPAQLSAPSPTVIWALYPQFNALFRSTDRGNTWELRPMPLNVGLPPQISFVDDLEGWLLTTSSPATQCSAESASIWHTTDAGASWHQLTIKGVADAQCKQNISFIDGHHGFVAAWDDNHRPTIYRTSDGGVTWTASTLPDPPGFTTYGAGDALVPGVVRSYDSTLLVDAMGMQPDGEHRYVFRSSDGGATWTTVASAREPREAVAFASETHWLQLDSRLETTDSGKSWHALSTDYSEAAPIAPEVVFADSLVGYATVRGDIQRTTDGGAHWTMLKSPGT